MGRYKNLTLENIVEEIEGVVYVEEWRHIIGFEGLYEISSFGRVKSLAKEWKSGKGVIRHKSDTIMVQVITKGYLRLTLKNDGLKKTFIVNRLVGIHYWGNPDNLPETNHLDGIKTNNFYRNLVWSTKSDNIKHALETGLKIPLKGEMHPNSRFKETDIIEIRRLHESGKNQREIAEIFGVKWRLIQKIVTGKRWKHIQ